MKLFKNYKTKKQLQKELEYYKGISELTQNQPYTVEELKLEKVQAVITTGIECGAPKNKAFEDNIKTNLAHLIARHLMEQGLIYFDKKWVQERKELEYIASIRVEDKRC